MFTVSTAFNTQLWKMKLAEKKLTQQNQLNFFLRGHSHTVKRCLADQFPEKAVNNPRDNSGAGKSHSANSVVYGWLPPQKHGFLWQIQANH